MKWRVEFHHKGKKEIEALPLKMRAKLEHIVRLLQDFGPSYVREPYVKHLQDELWEIRLKDKDGMILSHLLTRGSPRDNFLKNSASDFGDPCLKSLVIYIDSLKASAPLLK